MVVVEDLAILDGDWEPMTSAAAQADPAQVHQAVTDDVGRAARLISSGLDSLPGPHRQD